MVEFRKFQFGTPQLFSLGLTFSLDCVGSSFNTPHTDHITYHAIPVSPINCTNHQLCSFLNYINYSYNNASSLHSRYKHFIHLTSIFFTTTTPFNLPSIECDRKLYDLMETLNSSLCFPNLAHCFQNLLLCKIYLW